VSHCSSRNDKQTTIEHTIVPRLLKAKCSQHIKQNMSLGHPLQNEQIQILVGTSHNQSTAASTTTNQHTMNSAEQEEVLSDAANINPLSSDSVFNFLKRKEAAINTLIQSIDTKHWNFQAQVEQKARTHLANLLLDNWQLVSVNRSFNPFTLFKRKKSCEEKLLLMKN
jgi:ADP-glucose pyrophosphorylase